MDYKEYCNSQYGGMNDLEELFDDVDCHNDNVWECHNNDNCECHDESWECHEDDRDCCKRAKPKPMPKMGTIEVQSLLGCSDGDPISGMAIQLYKVDCNTGFELIDCKETDRCGKVVFKCLEDGLYAIKQPVDRCYFENPEYYPCYEVCISPRNKFARVIIINKFRKREEDCDRPPKRCRCKDLDECNSKSRRSRSKRCSRSRRRSRSRRCRCCICKECRK